jgi:hypothetical protein
MTLPTGPANDPDRYDPARDPDTDGRRSTLPELIGKEASFQDSPSPYIWVLGLIGIAAFLLVFAFVFSHLSP